MDTEPPSHGQEEHSAPKLSSLLAARLRADILGRELPEGTELPIEAELVRQEGVSRATVREALRILEHEGLVTTRRGSGGGAFVATPDARQTARSLAALLSISQAKMRDLFEFRRLVEPEAARLTALNRTDETATKLEELADLHELGAKREFHQIMANESGNKVLHIVLEAIYYVFGSFTLGTDILPHEIERASMDHREVAAAIRRMDGSAAAAAMSGHLIAWERRLEEAGRLDDPAVAPSSWGRMT